MKLSVDDVVIYATETLYSMVTTVMTRRIDNVRIRINRCSGIGYTILDILENYIKRNLGIDTRMERRLR